MKEHLPARPALQAICAWPVQRLPPMTRVRLVVIALRLERIRLVPRELTVLSALVPASRKHALPAILVTIARPREWLAAIVVFAQPVHIVRKVPSILRIVRREREAQPPANRPYLPASLVREEHTVEAQGRRRELPAQRITTVLRERLRIQVTPVQRVLTANRLVSTLHRSAVTVRWDIIAQDLPVLLHAPLVDTTPILAVNLAPVACTVSLVMPVRTRA